MANVVVEVLDSKGHPRRCHGFSILRDRMDNIMYNMQHWPANAHACNIASHSSNILTSSLTALEMFFLYLTTQGCTRFCRAAMSSRKWTYRMELKTTQNKVKIKLRRDCHISKITQHVNC